MKLFATIIIVVLISIPGCKNTSADKTGESGQTTDTTALSNATAEFQVKGMHCTGCENTIKTNIKELNGVTTVDASFKENKAIVAFDSTQTNESAIVAAIEDAGYKVDTFKRQ